MRLVGDWAKAGRIVDSMGAKFKVASEMAILREGHYLRGQAVKNITSGGQLAGAPFAPLSKGTLMVRRFRGFGGSKILMHTGGLRNSITVSRQQGGIFVGILRSAKTKGGKSAVNLAELHEFGSKTFTMKMTDKQRRFLMAAFRSKKGKGAASPGKGGGGMLTIKIPARPFIGPVFAKFAKPADVKKRFWAHVAKGMGYALGKPGP